MLIICILVIGYGALMMLLFSNLYSSNSKKVLFKQETDDGVFSIISDSGDPLSADSWEYFIDDHLIKKQYANYSNRMDTIALNNGSCLYLKIEQQEDSCSFQIIHD